MQSCISRPLKSATGGLTGTFGVPGDKSISIRALILGALASGTTRITGLLEAGDVLATADALVKLGATIARDDSGVWCVGGLGNGLGVGDIDRPGQILDLGNSGTGARLLMGVLATRPVDVTIAGDESLSRRPMDRVVDPLKGFGAAFSCRGEHFLPLEVTGARHPAAQSVRLQVPSAQVKSAILLAGLNAPGETEVIEPRPTRDHTERMLKAFGADISIAAQGDGSHSIRIKGQAPLIATDIQVPGDISSAAFFIVAASIIPGSELRLLSVGVNPTRSGLLDVMVAMGADISLENPREIGGEPVADLVVRYAGLTGTRPDPALAPRLIDEFPVLFVAAACATGRSVFRGLKELRIKESDRIAAMARGLAACGVAVEELDDGLVIEGVGGPPVGGGATGTTPAIDTMLDHRIAMAFLVLGAASRQPVTINDIAPVATSFPDFVAMMNRAGAEIIESGVSENG